MSLVIHWDLPSDAKDYVHRSGRTARAGKRGTVVCLIAPQHERKVQWLIREVRPGAVIEGDAPPERRPSNIGDRRPGKPFHRGAGGPRRDDDRRGGARSGAPSRGSYRSR